MILLFSKFLLFINQIQPHQAGRNSQGLVHGKGLLIKEVSYHHKSDSKADVCRKSAVAHFPSGPVQKYVAYFQSYDDDTEHY